ncbi:EF-hand domain-containing protein [Marivita sp. GX14005]|uniref:EF-hand domain-containing protein n=1 Tax=Marivita sp. GX14005 TaxID=2942276 RepID=UPI002019CADF|nr:EF-hand domain-containing protein [Marivita sp. GX14005]MCL3882158.1 EF-hand domain-containing protein [Marivita sp. GX14005]
MTRRSSISALFIATLVASSGATMVAAKGFDRGGQGRAEMFREMDANADGSVSAEEFAARKTFFDRADTDGDGRLTRGEIVSAAQARAENRADRMIARMDADGDGALSADEIGPRGTKARMFERLDSDGDGAISETEFREARGMTGWGRPHHGKARSGN